MIKVLLVCVNIERKEMFMYLRCDKKKKKILQMEYFLIPAFFFFEDSISKRHPPRDNEHNIGSKIKKQGKYNHQRWV